MLRALARSGCPLLVLSMALQAEPAEAFAHFWRITQVYSNTDGSVQFVELFTDDAGETGLSRMYLISKPGALRFDFDEDLVGSTVNKHVLVATAGFAALPGGVDPDFILPDRFLALEGGVIEFWSRRQGRYGNATKRDEFSFADLPGGTISLNRDFGDTIVYSEEALPTNYAGEVGAVPEPDARLLWLASLATLSALARRARGAFGRALAR